jgi:purine nucleosidase
MTHAPVRIVIDTDLGVDDAAAVAWLASASAPRVEIVGVSTSWGNTSVEHASANAAALLRLLGLEHVRVAAGARGPIVGTASRVGALVHGVDGLWGKATGGDARGAGHDDDLLGLYASVAREHPGATLLAIGPLTNLARLVVEAPDTLRAFASIVILGGALAAGSMTPVAETNFWHDPEAAEIVLGAGLPITLVTRDAHRAFSLGPGELARLAGGTAAARFLAEPVARYAAVSARFGEASSLPDVVAAMVAADPSIATRAAPALVRVVSRAGGLARGQSIFGFSPIEKLTMIEGGAALQRLVEELLAAPSVDPRGRIADLLALERDNARVVLDVDGARVRAAFLAALGCGA